MRIETFTVCLQNFLDKFVIDLVDSLGCGAVYLGKTWRRGRRLPPEVMNKARWVECSQQDAQLCLT